jgi:DNA-binding IclR family transcriptional regulator
MSTMSSPNESRRKAWHFLSNHTQVLLCIARDPDTRLRDIAQVVGITERAAGRIVTDLTESGYVESERHGRRLRYTINRQIAMRHPAQTNREIGELLDLLTRVDSAPESEQQSAGHG